MHLLFFTIGNYKVHVSMGHQHFANYDLNVGHCFIGIYIQLSKDEGGLNKYKDGIL